MQKPHNIPENPKSDPPQSKTRRPDDAAGLNIDEFIRIKDRDSGQVILEKRA